MARISHITLELAREPDHPHGDRGHGYHLYLPLTAEGHVDLAACGKVRSACRVRRFRPGEDEQHGRIRRGPGGKWSFAYDDHSDVDDAYGFRLTAESFVPGEYVSVLEDDGRMHPFQIIAVRRE